jgi:hypothetical protein
VSLAFFDDDERSSGFTIHDCRPRGDVEGFLAELLRINPRIIVAKGPRYLASG